jgi:hypothetical protein
MKEIVVKFTDEDYDRCVKEGQTEYRFAYEKRNRRRRICHVDLCLAQRHNESKFNY